MLTSTNITNNIPRQKPWNIAFGTGFTMLEMVTVIVLLGILAATVTPKLLSNNTFDEFGFAEESVAAVSYAQQRAMTSGCDIRVNFSSVGFRLDRFNTADCRYSAAASLIAIPRPGGNDDFSTAAPQQVTVGASTFYFDHVGRPSDASGLLSTVLTITIGTRTVQVQPETGYVRLL